MSNKRRQERDDKAAARQLKTQTLLPAIAPDQTYSLPELAEQAKLDACSDQPSLSSSLQLIRHLTQKHANAGEFTQVNELIQLEEKLVRIQLALAIGNDSCPSVGKLAGQAQNYLRWMQDAIDKHAPNETTAAMDGVKYFFSAVLDRRIIARLNQAQSGETINLPPCDQRYTVADQAHLEACSTSLDMGAALKMSRYQIQQALDKGEPWMIVPLIQNEARIVQTTNSVARRTGNVTTQATAARLENWLVLIMGWVLCRMVEDVKTRQAIFDQIVNQAEASNLAAGSPIDRSMLPIMAMEMGTMNDEPELKQLMKEQLRLAKQ
jgi:hypothetical protein